MKALLVIDMQNVCVGPEHNSFFQYDNETLINNVNKVISDNQDSIIIYIRNLMKKNILNKFAPVQVYEGTEESELCNMVNIVSDYVFDKYAGDAFSNPKLNVFLKEKNIEEIEIIGVDGGGCVSLTAFGAVKHGYKTIINTQAIGTVFKKNKERCFKKLKAKGAIFI